MAKRVFAWVFMIFGVWTALYPIGIALQVVGRRMAGVEPLEVPLEKVILNSFVSIVFGVGLFMIGRAMRKSAKTPAPTSEPPPRPDESN